MIQQPLNLVDILVSLIGKKTLNVTSYWSNKTITDPYLSEAVFTADLIFGNGDFVRVSTKPITVYGENSEILPYHPSLLSNPKVGSSYDLFGGSASQRSINLSLDAREVSPMEIVLSGSMIMGVGEIAIQYNGANYKDRYILVRGEMAGGITFGASDEVMEVTITDIRSSIDKIIPLHITSKEGFPTLPDDQNGLRYPLVLTSARFIPTIKLSGDSYGPTVMVAGGQEVEVVECYVDGVNVPAVEHLGSGVTIFIASNWIQQGGADTFGNNFTAIKFTTLNTPEYENVSVYAGVIPTSGQALSIMDVVEKLVSDYTLIGSDGYDYVLHARAIAKGGDALRGEIVINGSSTNNTASVFSYIDGAICNEFPMLRGTYTGRGFGIVYTDRANKTSTLKLVRGQDILIDRISGLTESNSKDIYNDFMIRYNYNAMTDTYQDIIQRNHTNSNLCRVSMARVGKREMTPIDSVLIKDFNTASKVIDWYVNHMTLPSYSISYCATPRLFFLVEIGDNIKITDDRLGLEEANATITSMEMQEGKVEFEVILWLQYDNIS